MNYFICTISSTAKHNWEICKTNNLWGIPTGNRKMKLPEVNKDDKLIVYQAGAGVVAIAKVTEPIRRPMSKEEAPWAGGVFRYGAIIPIKIIKEWEQPQVLTFINGMIDGTKVSVSALRAGFRLLSNKDAEFIIKKYTT
jgi:hypothetical protein